MLEATFQEATRRPRLPNSRVSPIKSSQHEQSSFHQSPYHHQTQIGSFILAFPPHTTSKEFQFDRGMSFRMAGATLLRQLGPRLFAGARAWGIMNLARRRQDLPRPNG
jgi:hypothetical protein